MKGKGADGWFKKHKAQLGWLIAIVIITRGIELLPLFRSLDRSMLDLVSHLHPGGRASQIYIVEIGEEDYRDIFGGLSPLNPSRVAALIQTIQKSDPAVIGVDLDTGGQQWCAAENSSQKPSTKRAGKHQRLAGICSDLRSNPLNNDESVASKMLANLANAGKIVWAGVPLNLDSMEKEDVSPQIECPLGGRESPFGDRKHNLVTTNQIGAVILPEDVDGKVREHRSEFKDFFLTCWDNAPGSRGDASRTLETFDVAVANMCETNKKCKEFLHGTDAPPWPKRMVQRIVETLKGWVPPKMELVDFSGQENAFLIVQAGEFLDKNGHSKDIPLQPMKGHIVLLGGAYSAARDEYRTAWGKMHGVELFANGIQSRAAGYTMPAEWPPAYILSIGVDLALGVLVIWLLGLMAKKKPGAAEGGQVGTSNIIEVTIAIAVALVSLVLLYEFYASNIWLGAVPVVVASVFLEPIHRMHEELKKARTKLAEVTQQMKDIQKQPAGSGKHLVLLPELPRDRTAHESTVMDKSGIEKDRAAADDREKRESA
jgi:CHASE2 domain-containing sensor protein